HLKRLQLAETQVTARGQNEIRAALPKLEIGWYLQCPDWYENLRKQGLQPLPNLPAFPYSPDFPSPWKQFEESQKSSELSWPGWLCAAPVVLLILAGAVGGLGRRRSTE